MNPSGDFPVLVTALLAGLLGSGHCFGMCGGIAGAFSAFSPAGNGRRQWWPGFLFNLGRILSYCLLGAGVAWLLGGAGVMLKVPYWARILRLVTAVMILLIGLRFLFDLRLLDRLETAGAGLWRHVRPYAVSLSARPGPGGRLLLGMCWGLLPCGLVYSMFLTAASTGAPFQAIWVMAAFGLGTLPSMLGLTWMSPALHTLLGDPVIRRVVGFSLVVLSAWSMWLALGHRMH